jgi:predicted transcriptional regulator
MTNENNQQNNQEGLEGKTGSLSLSDTTIFKDNPHLGYLYKKTERLVSALYLLSSFISDKEPVKWQMREAGVGLLSYSLSLSNRSSSERMLAYANFVSTGLKFLSFLEICSAGKIISEMNYNILKSEFESLIHTVESGEKLGDTKGLVFPDHFFEISGGYQNENLNQKDSPSLSATVLSKGQSTMSNRMSDKQKPVRQNHPIEDKSNRQEIIIDLLKKNPGLGIKDFTSAISGCSEKTIQRELASMVSKGLIKKEGEKRWSRYSLK